MHGLLIFFIFCCFIFGPTHLGYAQKQKGDAYFPTLQASKDKPTDTLAMVFHVALGGVTTSIRDYQTGLLTEPAPCLYAGIDYYGPWTRDAALNIWNGAGLLFPEVSRNTLLSVVKPDAEGQKIIDGEYWDCMIFTIGSWEYYLATGDKAFLKIALEASENTIAKLEREEFDPERGLFRGGAFFQDGISGYPNLYSNTGGNWLVTSKNG